MWHHGEYCGTNRELNEFCQGSFSKYCGNSHGCVTRQNPNLGWFPLLSPCTTPCISALQGLGKIDSWVDTHMFKLWEIIIIYIETSFGLFVTEISRMCIYHVVQRKNSDISFSVLQRLTALFQTLLNLNDHPGMTAHHKLMTFSTITTKYLVIERANIKLPHWIQIPHFDIAKIFPLLLY